MVKVSEGQINSKVQAIENIEAEDQVGGFLVFVLKGDEKPEKRLVEDIHADIRIVWKIVFEFFLEFAIACLGDNFN